MNMLAEVLEVSDDFKKRVEEADVKAENLLKGQTTEMIVGIFEESNASPVTSYGLYFARGAMMAELEKRDAEAFRQWLHSKEDSPRKFFIKKG